MDMQLIPWKKYFPSQELLLLLHLLWYYLYVLYQDMGKYQVSFTWGMAGVNKESMKCKKKKKKKKSLQMYMLLF